MKSNFFESTKQPNQLDRNRIWTSHLQHHLKINAEEINSMTSQLKRPNRLLQKKSVPQGKMNVTVSSYIEDTRLRRCKTLKVFFFFFMVFAATSREMGIWNSLGPCGTQMYPYSCNAVSLYKCTNLPLRKLAL